MKSTPENQAEFARLEKAYREAAAERQDATRQLHEAQLAESRAIEKEDNAWNDWKCFQYSDWRNRL